MMLTIGGGGGWLELMAGVGSVRLVETEPAVVGVVAVVVRRTGDAAIARGQTFAGRDFTLHAWWMSGSVSASC